MIFNFLKEPDIHFVKGFISCETDIRGKYQNALKQLLMF